MTAELSGMEAMDYNYFTGAGAQQYQYLNYGGDAGLLSHGNDGADNVCKQTILDLQPYHELTALVH